MTLLKQRIREALAEREKEDLCRRLVPREPDTGLIDLANNDYLRLSRHSEVISAGKAALERWGASASASPVITGYTEAHAQLEECLAAWSGFPCGLVWNTGYTANQAVLSCLPQRGDWVLADRYCHRSMLCGLLHSGARLQRYSHLDLDQLESLLKVAGHTAGREVFVVTESVFSVDGDYPDLKVMAQLKERYGFVWIVDEAHALGWYGSKGSGLVEATGVRESVDVLVGTLGKGLGSMGAYTLFRDSVIRDYLVNFAGEFIYSTYLAPACAAAAQVAIGLAEGLAEERSGWQLRSKRLRQAIPQALSGDSPIIPVVIGDPCMALQVAEGLKARGFRVGVVRPPTVPRGSSRLRLSLHYQLGESDERRLVTALEEECP